MRPNWIFFDIQPLARNDIQSWNFAVVFRKLYSIKGRKRRSKSTKSTPLGGAKVEVSGQNWGFFPISQKLRRRQKKNLARTNYIKALEATKILWVKVQKQKSYWVINFWTLVPIFSKLVNFGLNIFTMLESPGKVLKGTQSLWAKVQKQKSCGGQILRMIPISSLYLQNGLEFFREILHFYSLTNS